MLKVKSLNMTAGLSREEALADGVAVVKVTGVADPIAKGVCRFKADGTNTVALIHAAGNPSAITTPFAPSAITVEVEKVLNREVAVKKGDTSINTGLGDAVTAAKLDGTDVTGDLSHGVITIDAAAKDEVHELELTVLAASGAAEDTNVAGNALVLDAGPCYFSIIAEAIHMPGKKHSKTRCSVRGRKPWMVPGEDGPIHLGN